MIKHEIEMFLNCFEGDIFVGCHGESFQLQRASHGKTYMQNRKNANSKEVALMLLNPLCHLNTKCKIST